MRTNLVQSGAELLDGVTSARAVRAEVAEQVGARILSGATAPHLAAVLIGANPASETYVAMKERACRWVGIRSSVHRLSEHATQSEAESLVDRLNDDEDVHGILIQHPLPGHLNEPAVLDRVSPSKDVDGISRSSLGALVNGTPAFPPCTPAGIVELLDRYGIAIEGKHAVVVGRSIILGKPMALMLLARNATVTIAHSRTVDVAAVTRTADILVAAAGRPELIRGDMIRPGAVVVDAGYSRIEGRVGDVGDVEFDSASRVASYITPVPGGVGPMTIAILLRNTLAAAERRVAPG